MNAGVIACHAKKSCFLNLTLRARSGLLLGQTFGGADYSYFGYVILAGSFGLFLVYLAYGTYRRFLAWDKLDSV